MANKLRRTIVLWLLAARHTEQGRRYRVARKEGYTPLLSVTYATQEWA
jgi:hypothetical protein